jgi:hypothetical protein
MWVLIHTQPKSSRLDIRIARPWSLVQTLEARPYCTPLAQAQRLGLVGELLHRDDRAEDLVLDLLVVLLQPGEDGRLVEVAASPCRVPPVSSVAWSGSRSTMPDTRSSWFCVVERAVEDVLVVGQPGLGPLACSVSAATKSSWTPGRPARGWRRCSPGRR